MASLHEHKHEILHVVNVFDWLIQLISTSLCVFQSAVPHKQPQCVIPRGNLKESLTHTTTWTKWIEWKSIFSKAKHGTRVSFPPPRPRALKQVNGRREAGCKVHFLALPPNFLPLKRSPPGDHPSCSRRKAKARSISWGPDWKQTRPARMGS